MMADRDELAVILCRPDCRRSTQIYIDVAPAAGPFRHRIGLSAGGTHGPGDTRRADTGEGGHLARGDRRRHQAADAREALPAHRGCGGGPAPVPSGAVQRAVLLRGAAAALVRDGRTDPRRADDPDDAGARQDARHGHGRADLRRRDHRRVLQFGGGDRRRRHLPRQVSQAPHPARRSRLLGEVLFPSGQSRLPGLQHGGRRDRRLHLLRPALSGRGADPGAERRGDRDEPLGDRRRALGVSLEARAARARGRQRVFRRGHQPRRRRGRRGTSASSTARAISAIRGARSWPSEPRQGRARRRGSRSRDDPAGSKHVAVLPRSAAGDVRRRSRRCSSPKAST